MTHKRRARRGQTGTDNRKLKHVLLLAVAVAPRRAGVAQVRVPRRQRADAITDVRDLAVALRGEDGVGAVGRLARLGPLKGRQALLQLA